MEGLIVKALRNWESYQSKWMVVSQQKTFNNIFQVSFRACVGVAASLETHIGCVQLYSLVH